MARNPEYYLRTITSQAAESRALWRSDEGPHCHWLSPSRQPSSRIGPSVAGVAGPYTASSHSRTISQEVSPQSSDAPSQFKVGGNLFSTSVASKLIRGRCHEQVAQPSVAEVFVRSGMPDHFRHDGFDRDRDRETRQRLSFR